jgi:hypothetical protein
MLSMDSLRATVKGDTLAQGVAAIEADRVARTKAIEDAWSGGGAGSDRVIWRTQQEKELNALEDQRIAQLKEEYAIQQRRTYENLQVRDLASRGLTKEAAALQLQNDQQKEREDMVKSFGAEIDATEAATLALLDQVQAQEAVAAATNKAAGAALNMVSGYKVQAAIFGAMNTRLSLEGMHQKGGGSDYGSTIVAPHDPGRLQYPASAPAGGDLTVQVMMPNGETLGKVVIKDFKRRQRLGDAELRTVLS